MFESVISRKNIIIGALSFGLGALALSGVSAAPKGNKAELMALTGGKRVKVAWLQPLDKDTNQVKYYDSRDDKIIVLPFKGGGGPLFTSDGRYVLASVGEKAEREIQIYDTEMKRVRTLTSGPANFLLAVWTDPQTRRTWVYVNSVGEKDEAWNEAKGGPIYRFPIDNPKARELFWDRTSSHFFLMFSADGTRACFEPNWANIGQLKLAFAADGRVDQDKSVYTTFGGGCFPGFAPDNSYRMFRLEGDHQSITMCDADNANQRKIVTTDEQFGNGMTWLTRWSTHPRYLTCMAPDSDHAMVWIGRFDEGYTKIEKWVRVSETNAPKCWNSHAWVAPLKTNEKSHHE